MTASQIFEKWKALLQQMTWLWSPEAKARVSEMLDDLQKVPAIDCTVTVIRASNGDDYFTTLICGERRTQVYCFKHRYKAQYSADYLKYVLGLREDEPDVMAYDEHSHPNDRKQ